MRRKVEYFGAWISSGAVRQVFNDPAEPVTADFVNNRFLPDGTEVVIGNAPGIISWEDGAVQEMMMV